MDTNKDGGINPKELKTIMEKVGHEVSEETVNTWILIADTNGDGKVEEVCDITGW